MINQATDTTLRAMKLTGMANELARQIADPKSVQEMSFDERLAQLVDAEWRKRQASKLKKCISDACLRYQRAQIESEFWNSLYYKLIYRGVKFWTLSWL